MTTNPTQTAESAVKRAEELTAGDRVMESPGHCKPERPMRVLLVHPFTESGRRLVSLALDCFDGGEALYERVPADKRYEMADEQDMAAFRDFDRRLALAQALRQLADDIVEQALPIPLYRLNITGCVDSRAEIEQWAKHLGVDIHMGGTAEDIPVARKEIGVTDDLRLDVQFQSDPEPQPVEVYEPPTPEPDEARQEWLFTFGSGQEFDGQFVRISGTYNSTRSQMNVIFGHAWCAQYDWRGFDAAALPARVTELPESEWPPHADAPERPQLKHVSVLGNCINCGSSCPNGVCPNAQAGE